MRDDVGVEVGGVADLVEQLGGDGARRDDAPGAVVLGDDAAAVLGDLGDREPGVAAIGDLGREAVVAAGRLRTALDDVPGGDRAGQGVPVVAAPAVPPGGGPGDQARVGDPGADHHVRAGLQGRGDAPAAEVGVGGDHGQVRLGQRDPGVGVDEIVARGLQVAEDRDQVVAGEVGDACVQAEPAGEFRELHGQARRVEAAGVGDDLDAPLQAGAEHVLHLPQERGRVAEAGVLLPRLPQDQHGQLGQVVAGQHVDRAREHLPGGGEAVAVEPGAVRDAHRPSHRRAPEATGRCRPRPRRPARSPSTRWRPSPRCPG